MNRFGISRQGRPGDNWLAETVRWAWRTKIQVHLNIDLRLRLWTKAEIEAVRVFARARREVGMDERRAAAHAPAGGPADTLGEERPRERDRRRPDARAVQGAIRAEL